MLSTLGTLKMNHGVGTIVAKPSVSNYLRILDTVLRTKAHPSKDYLQVCQLLQPWVAVKVAEEGGTHQHLIDSLERLFSGLPNRMWHSMRIVERALSLSLTGRSGRCAAPKASISGS